MRMWIAIAMLSLMLPVWSLDGVAAERMAAQVKTADDAARQEQAARSYFTDTEVVTQDGKRMRFYSDVLKDRVVLINFVHTSCKNACPMMTRKLTLVRDLVESQLSNPIQFISISLDPARDTPAALKEFAKRHEADHAGWLFLTGKAEDVTHLIRKLGQYSEDLDAHSTIVLAGNVKTAHWAKIPPNVMPDAIAAKLQELVDDGKPKS